MREFDLLEVSGLGFEAEESRGVADITEEDDGGDGGDEEEDCEYLVEIFGEPCREI